MDKEWHLKLAELLDAYRIFPRLFITAYVILVMYSGWWVFHLPEVTIEAAGLVTGILGVGAAWFTAYVKSGRKYNDKDQPS